MRPKHLLFFDLDCPFCDKSVHLLHRFDKRKVFAFAPLSGKTAEKFLQHVSKVESLILIEDYRHLQRLWKGGKGVFRTLWLLGGFFKCLGIFYLLPSFISDPFYKLIAKHRHRILSKRKPEIKDNNYFLP